MHSGTEVSSDAFWEGFNNTSWEGSNNAFWEIFSITFWDTSSVVKLGGLYEQILSRF